MKSSLLSLPFLGLYLLHAWLFTFDVLLLSRRRARTPVAWGTICALLATLLYVIVTCGNLPKFDMKLPQFHLADLGFSGNLGGQDHRPGLSLWASIPDRSDSTGKVCGSDPGCNGTPVKTAGQSFRTPMEVDRQTEQADCPQQRDREPCPCLQDADPIARDPPKPPTVSPCIQCPDSGAIYLEKLQQLSRQVDHLRTQVENCNCKQVVQTVEHPNVEAAIEKALRLYDADKIGVADYALESAGGSVLSTRCTETYDTSMGRYYLFGYFPLFWQRPTARLAIQPTLVVGQCWPFKGSIGYLVLRLSRRIHVRAFTLEHIPASLAPAGNIDSAPNNFEVYGLENMDDTEGVLLGSFNYTTEGLPLQQFKVDEAATDRAFDTVELKILTNHGNIHYTCLYRFRVHGKPVQDDEVY